VLEADGSFKVIAVFGEAGGGAGTWTALVGVVVHSPHWGGGQGGTGVLVTPGEGRNLTVCMAIVGMVSLVVGYE